MYVCGMTVYDYCHIGHGRSMVAFDLVTRWLRFSGYDLTYVRNITDIDDKIINRANENGESFDALTERMIAAMHEDEARLNILQAGHGAARHRPHRRHARDDPDPDRQGLRLRPGQWRRVLPRRQVRWATASCRARRSKT